MSDKTLKSGSREGVAQRLIISSRTFGTGTAISLFFCYEVHLPPRLELRSIRPFRWEKIRVKNLVLVEGGKGEAVTHGVSRTMVAFWGWA